VKKTRSCGHKTVVACYRNLELEPCTEMVDKKIRLCGHYLRAQCCFEPRRTDCLENCSLKLKCGHECKQKCSILNCESKPCEEYVEPSVGPCGHMIERRCFEKTQGLFFWMELWMAAYFGIFDRTPCRHQQVHPTMQVATALRAQLLWDL
jgi:hypothetical protein